MCVRLLVQRQQALHRLAEVHQDLVRPLAGGVELGRGVVAAKVLQK